MLRHVDCQLRHHYIATTHGRLDLGNGHRIKGDTVIITSRTKPYWNAIPAHEFRLTGATKSHHQRWHSTVNSQHTRKWKVGFTTCCGERWGIVQTAGNESRQDIQHVPIFTLHKLCAFLHTCHTEIIQNKPNIFSNIECFCTTTIVHKTQQVWIE